MFHTAHFFFPTSHERVLREVGTIATGEETYRVPILLIDTLFIHVKMLKVYIFKASNGTYTRMPACV